MSPGENNTAAAQSARQADAHSTAAADLTDHTGRRFKVLRLSLTAACNFSCRYCVDHSDHVDRLEHTDRLQFTLANIKRLHALLNLNKVRLTGGEPTLHPLLADYISGLTAMGLDVSMTTNGYNLTRQAGGLYQAGLRSLNISLDSVDEESFARLAKRSMLQRVLDGIDAALETGMRVKLNATIMGGYNEEQVLPLLDFALSRSVEVRYLELMKMGHINTDELHRRHFVSRDDILAAVGTRYSFRRAGRQASATAIRYEIDGGGTFGIIANHSESFCSDCNRLRLDTKGKLYGCLSNDAAQSIRPDDSEESLRACLQTALGQKTASFSGSRLSMKAVGG